MNTEQTNKQTSNRIRILNTKRNICVGRSNGKKGGQELKDKLTQINENWIKRQKKEEDNKNMVNGCLDQQKYTQWL